MIYNLITQYGRPYIKLLIHLMQVTAQQSTHFALMNGLLRKNGNNVYDKANVK